MTEPRLCGLEIEEQMDWVGGGENEASIVRQGGRGHHNKGEADRKGIIEEPTELGKWQNVEKIRKREESSKNAPNLCSLEKVVP